MSTGSSNQNIEVEAKFLGGRQELEAVLAWLKEGRFSVERKSPVHRIHVYFDHNDKLRSLGCRLRCIIAAGEWCRYDFKADDPTGRGNTTEVSVRRSAAIPLQDAAAEIAQSIPEGAAIKSWLLDSAARFQTISIMTGRHQKAVARRDDLDVEVSWDVLTPLDSGVPLSEVEIELLRGECPAFDSLVQALEGSLQLKRGSASKLQQAIDSHDTT